MKTIIKNTLQNPRWLVVSSIVLLVAWLYLAHGTSSVQFETPLPSLPHVSIFPTRLPKIDTNMPEAKLEFVSGTIKSNLYHAGHTHGLSNRLIMQLSKIFSWKINFARELRPGDHFEILYQTYYLNGKKTKDGSIIAAQFTTHGKTYAAIRDVDAHGRSGYYTPKGLSVQRSLTRRPLYHARISSKFSLHRYHPILHIYRPHYGVDFAAPWGTPVHAAGNGVIVEKVHSRGYGRHIVIKHNRRYKTVYGHMARFAKHIYRGQYVKKGQIIGYVGNTGLSTGPHLHFEIRVNNIPRNPLRVKLPSAWPIAKKHLHAFKVKAKNLLARLKLQTQAFRATHL